MQKLLPLQKPLLQKPLLPPKKLPLRKQKPRLKRLWQKKRQLKRLRQKKQPPMRQLPMRLGLRRKQRLKMRRRMRVRTMKVKVTTLDSKAAGDITLSLGALFSDWFTDNGQPGDNYDPELAELAQGIDQGLTLDPTGVQAVLDRLEEVDPVGFGQVAVNNPDGVDLTLVQFDAFTGDQDVTVQMVDDLEGLWFGDRDQITATSGDITALEITGAMTEGQTTSIAITLLAALIVLMIFFWVTEFKPMLGFIAVSPILLVLLWVLGAMTLLDIPYNVVTALITALSIGIGVDYTIHVIHRFTEELEHGKSLMDATTTTLSTTGSALIGSALTTALAFAVLLLSPLLPFQQFGLVTGITILFALIASIVVVPPMLLVWAAYHQWRAGMEH